MTRRLQFSLRTTLSLVFVIALVAWPTTSWLRTYLANRGLVPVKGRVTFKGQPLQDAKIVFVPAKAGGKQIEGVTNAVGDFELEPFATPGEYVVTITELGAAKRGLSPKYGNASMSELTVSVSATGLNSFEFLLSD